MLRICRNEVAAFLPANGLRSLLLLFIACLLNLSAAYAADYPTKPIQIIVPTGPGGGADMVSRILSNKLAALLGQPVVVVNKPGGGLAIGIQAAADAKPDGYTILSAIPINIISIPLITKGIAFRIKDFTPVYIATSSPGVIVVKKDSPWKTLDEMIGDAKKNPGKFTYSSGGAGTTGHFASVLFKMVTATDITAVPMSTGEAQSITTLLGGHVDMAFSTWSWVREHLHAGTLRALAVMSKTRLKEFPDVPTTVEKGYSKVLATICTGYFVPVKTPPGIVKRLGEAFNVALEDKENVEKLRKVAGDVMHLGPEEAAKFVAEEQQKWSEVVRTLGIAPK